jgi:hypothetical protein
VRDLHASSQEKTMADALTHKDFEPELNKTFSVKGHKLSLTLASVHAHELSEDDCRAKDKKCSRKHPFDLVFSASGDVLNEGLYTLSVKGGKEHEIYLVPNRRGGSGPHQYRASFN